MPGLVARRAPSHLISLLDPEHDIPTPEPLTPERHLRLGLHDINDPGEGLTAPDEAAVVSLLAFARLWDEAAPLLVHCFAGISRSTASAFVLACERNPGASESGIALGMRRLSPQAYPNRRLVALADDMLGRRGRMVDAVRAMGGNDFVPEGAPFDLPARYPAP